ncbi:MAG: O-antigen ligase family protein [Sphingomicrobium sp.]
MAIIIGIGWTQWRRPFLPSSSNAPLALLLAVLFVILSQLTPLPYHPAIVDAVFAMPGVSPRWRPFSIDPASTIRFAASLMVPTAMALCTLSAGRNGRQLLIRSLVLLAMLSAMLGMVQLALGYPSWASPFGMPDAGFADGLFVNRNHQATFLLVGLLAAGAWIGMEGSGSGSPLRLAVGEWRVHAVWFAFPLLAMMTVAAGSRAGILFLAAILPVATLLARPGRGGAQALRLPRWVVPLGICLLVAVIVGTILPGDDLARLRAKLVFSRDARFDLLPDVLTTLRETWPRGSGFGTFVPAFKAFEDLDKVGPSYFNHAHNEYLEWLIEGGIAAAACLLAAIIIFATRLWLVLASGRSGVRKSEAVLGAAILLLLALHNGVDYPLRTDALAAVAGLAIGLLFTPALDLAPRAEGDKAEGPAAGRRNRIAVVGLALFALTMTGQIMRLRLAEAAGGDGNAALAAAIHSHDGIANAYVAEALLAAGQTAAARQQALAAIDQAPLNVVALRTLAMADARLGDQTGARAAWRTAASLGWRDIPVQYWAMRQALADHQNDIAGARADALLRLSDGSGPFAAQTRIALANPDLRKGLASRLALRPYWRTPFFSSPEPLTDAELNGMIPTLLEMQRSSAPPLREEARWVIAALLQRGRLAEALMLDRPFQHERKPDQGSLLDDGDFNRTQRDYQSLGTPFDWLIGNGNGNIGDLDEAPPRAAVVTTDGSVEEYAIRRYAVLRPGRYAITFKMSGAPDSPSAIGMVVRCGTIVVGRSPTDSMSGTGFQPRRFEFDVPANCPIVMIGLGGFGGGSEADGEIDEVRLAPVSASSTAR